MKAHTSGRVDFENNDRVGVRVCFGARVCRAASALKWAVTHTGYSLIQTTGRERWIARQRSTPAASTRARVE